LYEHGQNHSLDHWYDFAQGINKIAETNGEGRAYQEVDTYFYDPLMAQLFLELLKDMQIPIYDIRKKAQAKNEIIYIKFKKELMRSSDIIKHDWAGNHRID
jgi:ATP-dependent RNA circularization protein (DNA/RNA ligase family)